MFKINSTRPIAWPGFVLLKGDNEFLTRKAVPAELWPKLERFRELGILAFEGKPEAGAEEPLKLDELTERQIYDLDKVQLAELAKASGIVGLAEGAKKKDIVDALVAKLPKAAPVEQAEAKVVPAGSSKAARAAAVDVGPATRG